MVVLQVSLPIVDTIHLKGGKILPSVRVKATVDSKLNDSPESYDRY